MIVFMSILREIEWGGRFNFMLKMVLRSLRDNERGQSVVSRLPSIGQSGTPPEENPMPSRAVDIHSGLLSRKLRGINITVSVVAYGRVPTLTQSRW